MTYNSLHHSHAQLGTNTIINELSGKINIVWTNNTNPATLANGDTFFTLKFVLAGGTTGFSSTRTTNLTWDNAITGNNEFSTRDK